VRLGSSGLKVSKFILGCMSYGSPEWQGWVLDEEASLEQIKYAYDAGINAFDTANVSKRHSIFFLVTVMEYSYRYTPMGVRKKF
jgi:aryl-alcohol dehydrogenase-like predicted oxidoreductase